MHREVLSCGLIQSINQPIDHSNERWISQSINQSIEQWISRTINQSIKRSNERWITRTINQSIDQTHQSLDTTYGFLERIQRFDNQFALCFNAEINKERCAEIVCKGKWGKNLPLYKFCRKVRVGIVESQQLTPSLPRIRTTSHRIPGHFHHPKQHFTFLRRVRFCAQQQTQTTGQLHQWNHISTVL